MLFNKALIYLRPNFVMTCKVCFEKFYENVSETLIGDDVFNGYDYLRNFLFFDF